jgi:WD40 repeat protein
MTQHVRATALSFACTLLGCRPGAEPVVEPEGVPGPIAEVEMDPGALPITPIPQLTPIETSEWRFEPGSRRFSSSEFNDCSIWDVESGRLIRTMPEDVDQAEPCTEWLPGEYLFSSPDISTDERLELDTSSGVAILDAQTGKLLHALPCPDCDTHSAITWARTGHQLAIAWEEPPRVQIWDADTAKLVRAEAIPLTTELDQLELGWTEGGATVLWTEQGFAVECESYEYDCYYNEVEQVLQRRPYERQALLLSAASKSVIQLGEVAGFEDVLFDPEGRWAFWRRDWSEPRGDSTIELHFEGLAGQGSGIGWQSLEEYGEYEGTMNREGMWRNDGATHWAVSVMVENADISVGSVGWETILASPALGRRTGVVIAERDWDTEVTFEVFGFAGDALRVSGEACTEDGCEPLGVVPGPGCELLDVASGHASELLDCEGQLFLRNGGGTKRLPHDPAALTWWWSRGGALVLQDSATFTVLDAASGVGGLHRSDPLTVLEGRLGLEIDRLVLITDLGLEVVDLGAGKVVANFPDVFPEDVAFSPTGDRLALLDDGQIRVLSLPSGEALASWPVDAAGLAFRQDGKVIFTGSFEPEQAFDAASGRSLDPAALVPVLEAIEFGEIDPSWRWIMNDETQQLVRTLDGLMLAWLEGGAWLPATGQYQGAGPGAEIAYRVGIDVLAVPVFDAEDLSKWLKREDLVELFLSGQPIPKPSMTNGELAGVRAAVESKKKP